MRIAFLTTIVVMFQLATAITLIAAPIAMATVGLLHGLILFASCVLFCRTVLWANDEINRIIWNKPR